MKNFLLVIAAVIALVSRDSLLEAKEKKQKKAAPVSLPIVGLAST